VLWGGCRTPQGETFEPLISRRARGPFPWLRRTPSKCLLSRSLRREREGKGRKEIFQNSVAHLFRGGHHDGGETAPARLPEETCVLQEN
jgi:hypothetical protein